MSNNGGASGGIGFLGLLCILFIGLKLTNVIDWEWWVVLMPLWAPVALVMLLLLFLMAYNSWDNWRWRH